MEKKQQVGAEHAGEGAGDAGRINQNGVHVFPGRGAAIPRAVNRAQSKRGEWRQTEHAGQNNWIAREKLDQFFNRHCYPRCRTAICFKGGGEPSKSSTSPSSCFSSRIHC